MPDVAVVTAPIESLQARLGHRFSDPRLLDRALTHKSFGTDNNERLEFLGDAVLSAAVAGLLYRHFADAGEGDLSRVRAHLVCEGTLHRLALPLGLPNRLRLSEGEARNGGAQRPSILADALEALIGAVYLDGGYATAQALVERLFSPLLATTVAEAWTKDAKTGLQEWLHARRQQVPHYRVESTRGRPHEQTFVVLCSVPGLDLVTRGEGRSRRAAEQAAASAALEALQAAASVSSPRGGLGA